MNFPKLVAVVAAAFLSACGVGELEIDENGNEVAADAQDALVLNGRFETFVGQDGRHYFHLLAGNGEKVLASQGYSTASGAKSGISTVKANGVNPARYLMREASDGSSYFVLVGGNGAIIGVSQMYSTASNATRAVGTVQSVIGSTVTTTVAPMAAKFESFKGLDGKFYFHVRAANGEIVLQSQGYTSSTGANTGISSVQTNGGIASRYQVRAAADGSSYFVLKAGNGAVIGRGESYSSASNAQRGVEGCVALLTGSVPR